MIKKIEYKFIINEWGVAQVRFEDEDFPLWEITCFDLDQLPIILNGLAELQEGKRPYFAFIKEMYYYDCEQGKCKVQNTLEGNVIEAEIELGVFIQFVKDWYAFLGENGFLK